MRKKAEEQKNSRDPDKPIQWKRRQINTPSKPNKTPKNKSKRKRPESIRVKDALEEAQELASQSPNDPTQQENLEEAKSEFAQQRKISQGKESASLAEEQANN